MTVRRTADRPSGPGTVSVETLHPMEIKHAICVKSFHGMRSFHVVAALLPCFAACGTAAPSNGHARGLGSRGRRSVNGALRQGGGILEWPSSIGSVIDRTGFPSRPGWPGRPGRGPRA